MNQSITLRFSLKAAECQADLPRPVGFRLGPWVLFDYVRANPIVTALQYFNINDMCYKLLAYAFVVVCITNNQGIHILVNSWSTAP